MSQLTSAKVAGATAEQANSTQVLRNPYEILQEIDGLSVNHPGGTDRPPNGAGTRGTHPPQNSFNDLGAFHTNHFYLGQGGVSHNGSW